MSVGGGSWNIRRRADWSWYHVFFQVRCRAVPAHWTPDWQEAASVPHARGRSYDADRACGRGPETCSNGGHWLFVPLLAVVVWISSGAITSWSTSWLRCRNCGSKERRSDLGMMMMTQKKLLVSGIRWQVGKRRGGKPSSSVFGQTFKIFSMATWAWQKQSTKPSPVNFFENYLRNLAAHLENSSLSSASLVTDWAWPILIPRDWSSFQRHQSITSGPESHCGLALLVHREAQCECSFPTAAARTQRVHLGSARSVRRKREKLIEPTEFPQHMDDAPALVKRCDMKNSKYILLNFKAAWFSFSYHWSVLLILNIGSARFSL